jgi:hypothetical protein
MGRLADKQASKQNALLLACLLVGLKITSACLLACLLLVKTVEFE